MNFLYCIYQLIVAPLLLLLTAITAIVTTIGCTIASAPFWSYWPARCWSRAMCTILLLPVEVHGKEHLQKGVSYVFTPNHQGSFDIFLVYGYLGRPFKWMMKKSLRKIFLVGRACEDAGHIFVDNSGPKATAMTMQQARDVLHSGTSLVAFPEGERTLTGAIGPFRRGPFNLAAEIGLDVVPVVIRGSYEVLPRQKGFWFVKWHRLRMDILEPIAHEHLSADELRQRSFSIISNFLSANS
ncbi:MAG: 1-acyl-sn-glycerol-3-phosphate acyltransferase [Bacteroidaceae bacterium]|nr:1-acyl-sn-glycerol-3-phosphate acyltransferase [Bacteroidaceae bacterium]